MPINWDLSVKVKKNITISLYNVEISVLPQPIIELYTLQIPLIECSIICNDVAQKKEQFERLLFFCIFTPKFRHKMRCRFPSQP